MQHPFRRSAGKNFCGRREFDGREIFAFAGTGIFGRRTPKEMNGGKIGRMTSRRILIFTALPYANGDIHLGHLVEYIQADIWARFQRARGRECYFCCADDSHGTPVMLRAEAENTDPEELIGRMQKNHLRDFRGFHIEFDNYHSTHSEENRALSEEMFARLQAAGCIAEREIRQLYDGEKKMFLPDRYVRGECPKCAAADQYGDSCERCGAAYAPEDLKNPVSALSGARPSLKTSLHYFLRLDAMREELSQWTRATIDNPARPGEKIPRLQKEAANKMSEWLSSELRDWDISRDAPYFGFRIPGAAGEKYFYVWLDAPIGYMASFQNFCDRRKDVRFDDFWGEAAEDKTELYHFIGKDILYFHALFWPAMLKIAGWRRPTRIFAHGFLSVNGEKMSKSRGTFITARRYLDCGLNPECLRYYYACKLNDRVEDLDLSLADFSARVNGDLVGKLFNIPSRVGGFLTRLFDGKLDSRAGNLSAALAATSPTHNNCYYDMVRPVLDIVELVEDAYENRRYQKAMREIMHAVDKVNVIIDAWQPWKTAKDIAEQSDAAKKDALREELHEVCSAAMRAFHLLMVLLQPVLPQMAEEVKKLLKCKLLWGDKLQTLPAEHYLPDAHVIDPYHHLLKRMTDKDIRALIQPEDDGSDSAAAKADDSKKDSDTPTAVAVDDFAKIHLQIATVTAAEEVEGADKLLRLQLDAGDGRRRQVFAGIKKHYAAADLVGRRVVYLSNLKTRKMRFGDSEGMVLAAADGDKLWLATADGDAPPGARVR